MDSVLVTGGAGFIGQQTVRALLSLGFDVRVLDALKSPVHQRPEWPGWMSAQVECRRGDIRSEADLLAALRGVDMVLHLAAYQDYLPDFSTFIQTNGGSTALLYELIVSRRLPITRVVIASSQSVYGEGAHRCAEHGIQFPNARSLTQLRHGEWDLRCSTCHRVMEWTSTDEGRVNPQNPYGISKLSQELLGIQLGHRYEIPTVALRYSITQGAGQSFYNAYSGICRIFSSCALQGVALPVYEDGRQQRDYVYVGDVVAANLLACQDQRMDYETYNVGGEQPITVRQYGELVATVAGVEPLIQAGGRFRVGDTRHIVSDSSKLRALGWRNTKHTSDVIDEYVHWAATQPLPARGPQAAAQRMREVGALEVVG